MQRKALSSTVLHITKYLFFFIFFDKDKLASYERGSLLFFKVKLEF